MAPYQTEERLPRVTLPITEALGATKISLPSFGRTPSNSKMLRCLDTAPEKGALVSYQRVLAQTWGGGTLTHPVILCRVLHAFAAH